MSYVDGFILAVPRKNLAAYLRMARTGGKVWRDHGALDYKECLGDDLKVKFGISFPRLMKARRNEVLFYSFIVHKSRRHRDRTNARVMQDKRLASMMDPKKMPFDMRRMAYGGFKVLVDA